MINVAIVEDEEIFSSELNEYLKKYGIENEITFKTTVFANAVVFLETYKHQFDLVFLDIRMPYMSGMEAAKQLREKDENVALIFVTNLAQYAVESYAVDAIDYILKPMEYNEFSLKLSRVIRKIGKRKKDFILIPTAKEGGVRIQVSEIRYVESRGHYSIYHMGNDVQYVRRSPLYVIEKELGDNFKRCNNCYLVNLSHIEKIKGMSVFVGNDELQISQPRKKSFYNEVREYMDE